MHENNPGISGLHLYTAGGIQCQPKKRKIDDASTQDKTGDDIWERLYGLNPANAADASSDADADGQTALAEFHSRTNPADPKSLLRIEKFTAFPYPGSEHSVQLSIEFSWHRMPGVMCRVETSTDRHLFEFGETVGSPMLFYRVKVENHALDGP